MKNNEEIKKKNLLLFLIIITFVIILIAWRLYLKIFPQKRDETKGDTFLLELINQGIKIKESFKETFQKIKDLRFHNFSNEEFVNQTSQQEILPKTTLTNEEAARLKEKILEYINQESY